MAKDEGNRARTEGKVNGGTEHTAEAPKATATELKALFKRYEESDREVTKARKILEQMTEARNVIVEEIATKAGKGPFKLANGKVLTATQREGTWFFRSPQPKNAIEVG